jgi:hypothetical protein
MDNVLSDAQHHATTANLPKDPQNTTAVHANDDGDADIAGDDFDDTLASTNYYTCPLQQKEFNARCKKSFFGDGNTKSPVFYPNNLLGGRCQPKDIGVSQVHIFAPHLHLGLPFPPCPSCGWRSVDDKMVTTKGAADDGTPCLWCG